MLQRPPQLSQSVEVSVPVAAAAMDTKNRCFFFATHPTGQGISGPGRPQVFKSPINRESSHTLVSYG